MKRLFFTVCLLAGIVSFSACGGGDDDNKNGGVDKVKPTITIPTNANNSLLKLDLGDKKKALEGVTAIDDVDGDITSSIQVSGNFERVGKTQLKYKVSDKAGNVTEVTRTVIISAGKLAGTYSAIAKLQKDTTAKSTFNLVVNVEQDTVITLNYIQNKDKVMRAKYTGDYLFSFNDNQTMDYDGSVANFTGTITYGTSTENYKIVSMAYKFTYTLIQKEELVWNVVCTPK